MPRYQFFVEPNSDRKKFTYLEMGTASFLKEKEMLLSNGMEVDGDVIFAKTPEEAVKLFKSNFIHVMEEYHNSSPLTALVTATVGWFSRGSKK